MKTTVFFTRNIRLMTFVGLISSVLAACGSYQNSSYYSSDGIYGDLETRHNNPNTQKTMGDQYQAYFSSLQDSSNDIFTDVESYSSTIDANDSIQASITGNAAWGSTSESTTIYINNGWNNGFSPYWGWGWNTGWWGWNNWYGPNWGWNGGWGPGWGWGGIWGPSWGWGGYPGGWHNYPYNRYTDYNYNSSRRGANYYNRSYVNRNYYNRVSKDNFSNRRVSSESGRRDFNSYNKSTSTFNRRSNPTPPTRNYDYSTNRTSRETRSYNTNPTNEYNRSNSTRRSSNYSPSPSYTPSRSYSPSSSGGMRSSGSYGGGRRGRG